LRASSSGGPQLLDQRIFEDIPPYLVPQAGFEPTTY
jgi:hypothetical protein